VNVDWRELRDRLRPFVGKRVAVAADVDDVVQEVLLRMHRGLAGLRDDERLAPWMYQIARTAIADHGRGRARHPLTADELADDAVADARDPRTDEPNPVPARIAATLAFFTAHLPSPYRAAITLTELEGKTQREAADMLGVSLPALKSHVLRGRARLRAMLERCCAIAVDARGTPVECIPRTTCAPGPSRALVRQAPADAPIADEHRGRVDAGQHARQDRGAGGQHVGALGHHPG
jgi:RNA polymerase sigma-70 factor (ECF subfamily)